MSNFLNKIPVSPITSFGNPSVPNGSTIGTNFSILQTGGYMEIYSLSGLTYTIPPATTGVIEFSGNSIPIQFTKGAGSIFSPDVLTLNSDNISSGRRKLGMLVYVYETNKIYQFKIDNYDTLWNNATGETGPGGATVVISDFGTTVKNNSAAGIAFINAWTASTISGVGGYNDTNASWRVLSTGGSGGGTFTGGTVTGATIFTNGLTATTISANTITSNSIKTPILNVTTASPTITISGQSLGTATDVKLSINSIPGSGGAKAILSLTPFGITSDAQSVVESVGNFDLVFKRNNVEGLRITSGDVVKASTISATTYLNLPSSGGSFTGGTVSGATNFTGGLTANTITSTSYNGYNPLPTQAAISSGVTLSFITDTVYGTLLIPENGFSISADTTNGQLGVTDIIIHSGSTPTFSSQYKKLSGSSDYSAGTINYIFCTYISSDEIIYSINQRT
jgi:hypothetical protein